MRWSLAATSLLILFLRTSSAEGHGEVHPRIEALTQAIDRDPGSARLLRERGVLYTLDEDWSAALADFATAYARAPEEPGLEHHLGNALLHLGAPVLAKGFLDAAIVRDASVADAHLLRARANVALDDLDAALDDFDQAIALTPAPSPETYLERANAIVSLAPDRAGDALEGLAAGRRRLGPLVTLIERSVELSRGEQALAILAELPPGLAASYRWQAKRAAILAEDRRDEEAATAFREALATIDRLPEGRRRSEATARDRADIAQALATLPTPAPTATPRAESDERAWLSSAIVAVVCLLGVATWRVRRTRAATPPRREG